MAVGAVDRCVVDDDAAAHTRAQREQDQAVVMAARSNPEFAVGRGGRIVCVGHIVAAVHRHTVADREVVPAGQVARAEDYARRQILRPRCAQANAGDVARGDAYHAGECVHHPAHPRGGILGAPFHVRRLRVKGEHPPVVVDERRLDVGAAEIDAGIERQAGLRERQQGTFLGAHARTAQSPAGSRLVSTVGVGPVQAFMNSTRSAFSWAESLRGRIFALK